MQPFERSEDHHLLYSLLSKAQPGDLISYAAMSDATGKPVTGSFGPLASVFRRLLDDDGMTFTNIRKVGYRRLRPDETVDEAYDNRARLHRHARRNTRRLITVDADFHTLDQAHRIAYAVGLSLFQALTAATTLKSAHRLEEAVKRTDMRPLPFFETIAAFQKAA